METLHIHRFSAAQPETYHIKESTQVPWEGLLDGLDFGLLCAEMDCNLGVFLRDVMRSRGKFGPVFLNQ